MPLVCNIALRDPPYTVYYYSYGMQSFQTVQQRRGPARLGSWSQARRRKVDVFTAPEAR